MEVQPFWFHTLSSWFWRAFPCFTWSWLLGNTHSALPSSCTAKWHPPSQAWAWPWFWPKPTRSGIMISDFLNYYLKFFYFVKRLLLKFSGPCFKNIPATDKTARCTLTVITLSLVKISARLHDVISGLLKWKFVLSVLSLSYTQCSHNVPLAAEVMIFWSKQNYFVINIEWNENNKNFTSKLTLPNLHRKERSESVILLIWSFQLLQRDFGLDSALFWQLIPQRDALALL